MTANTLNMAGGLIRLMSLQDRITEAVNAALAKGLSLADIARTAVVTQSALTQWMDGTTKSLKLRSGFGGVGRFHLRDLHQLQDIASEMGSAWVNSRALMLASLQQLLPLLAPAKPAHRQRARRLRAPTI